MFWIIIIGTFILSFAVSQRLKNKFKKYSQTPLASGLSGAEIAQMMLQDHGIHDVRITMVKEDFRITIIRQRKRLV